MKVCMDCHLTYDDTAQVCAQCGNPLISVTPKQENRPITQRNLMQPTFRRIRCLR